MSEGWSRSRAAGAGAVASAVLLIAGGVFGRPDVAVLGAAPLIAAAWTVWRQPSGQLTVRVEAWSGEEPTGAGEDGADAAPPGSGGGEAPVAGAAVRARVLLDAPQGADTALLGVRRAGRDVAELLVRVDGRRSLPLLVRTVRTGPQEVATVEAQAIGPGAASISEPTDPVGRTAMVLPGPSALRDLPLPPRLRGLTGAHTSRRPGEGGDLRDVHQFAPGDRLRRIDWRVTARRAPDLRELYVRREHALAEAVVLLVVDSRDDVGPDPRTWRGAEGPRAQDATSLDLGRHAAASLAQGYLGAGDRVGLDDLGARRRPLPPGGGRRQLDRIRHALAVTRPEGEPPKRLRPPQIPSGALVVVFSTFLDDEASRVAGQWRQAGHRVIAVDVLPELREGHLDDRERLALRLVRLAREDRLAELADLDVEIVQWRDDPAVGLAGLARRGQRRPGAGVPA
ncbi:DUF58 domain-containing protein [Cellulomonas chengniuliangii]|uniref:DUF58 domain-containing protein n=1 Tax=Cellulomonas chengniuliangii TaxID=2968084 RepID=A0ABY5KZZ1_9CELL|nr:DUF58 domain-containing protein [Cellulomonas chengniuliangii]MCC2309221.1 DUF58 domain-containing protein [Cellulomonas chengniuliangii]MCC2318565.1 DUF58 domain-containing protein [Cellulomonas chengniuliangii]UUI75204.1 DUF58 domain-containing protein [Cellulomonas chengniuliangii]